MQNSRLMDILVNHDVSVSLDNILQNSKASSGGSRDVSFLRSLLDNRQLMASEAILKRSSSDIPEEYYHENYKKLNMESDRHFLCRAIIQDELKKLGVETMVSVDLGEMNILRENSCYDVVLSDFSAAIDIGLTPARNFYKGLTDLRVKNYLITNYFDDYIDDIVFFVLSRNDDKAFIDAVKEFQATFDAYPVLDTFKIHDALSNQES